VADAAKKAAALATTAEAEQAELLAAVEQTRAAAASARDHAKAELHNLVEVTRRAIDQLAGE
jgi:hypothetical protein